MQTHQFIPDAAVKGTTTPDFATMNLAEAETRLVATALADPILFDLFIELHAAAQQHLRCVGHPQFQSRVENRLRVVTEAITNYFEGKRKCPK